MELTTAKTAEEIAIAMEDPVIDPDSKQTQLPLNEWEPEPHQMFVVPMKEVKRCFVDFERALNTELPEYISTFIINSEHYNRAMTDFSKHINYFIEFYDYDKEYLPALFTTKYFVDSAQDLIPRDVFKRVVIDRFMNDSMIRKIYKMVNDLYVPNINTDEDGKYKNVATPKITNADARGLLTLSFAIRLMSPICVHYSQTKMPISPNTPKGKERMSYMSCFDSIFIEAMTRIENIIDYKLYSNLCYFVEYRMKQSLRADAKIWADKMHLYGITPESELHDVIHNIILVKTLHKVDYSRSIVAFLDGVIKNHLMHFAEENYIHKPVEISAQANAKSDSDDYMSQLEALEMQIYRIDESNSIINDANIDVSLRRIYDKLNVNIDDEEFDFYINRVKMNSINRTLLHAFFSKYFHDSSAINIIGKFVITRLLIILKKYLQLNNMPLLAQICTADIEGKLKNSPIKNNKFMEKLHTDTFTNIVDKKFKYLKELGLKNDPILNLISTISTSAIITNDYYEELDKIRLNIDENDMNQEKIIDEFCRFLAMI